MQEESIVVPHAALARQKGSGRRRVAVCGAAGVLLCCACVAVVLDREPAGTGTSQRDVLSLLIDGRTVLGDAGLEGNHDSARAKGRVHRVSGLDDSSPLLQTSPQAAHLQGAEDEDVGPSGSQQGEQLGHWGGAGSENYGTPQWDNTGWNAHYHPRDGASMDSESMEPWYWRKGPRVNDEYTGHMADGDPLFSPPDGWEPPINYHDSAYLPHDDAIIAPPASGEGSRQ
jgi:hypothetical protein